MDVNDRNIYDPIRDVILFDLFLSSFRAEEREPLRFALTGYPGAFSLGGLPCDERSFIEAGVLRQAAVMSDTGPALAGQSISYPGYKYSCFLRGIDLNGRLAYLAGMAARYVKCHCRLVFGPEAEFIINQARYTVCLYLERFFVQGVDCDFGTDKDLVNYFHNFYGAPYGYRGAPPTVCDYRYFLSEAGVLRYDGLKSRIYTHCFDPRKGLLLYNLDDFARALFKIGHSSSLPELGAACEFALSLSGAPVAKVNRGKNKKAAA